MYTAGKYYTTGGRESHLSGDQVTLRAYLEGYRAALTTVALAFGLSLSIIAGQRETLEVEARIAGEALSPER